MAIELPSRIPPQNLDAERAVLGAVLLEGAAALARIRPILQPSDFYTEAHRAVYLSMCSLLDRREPVDLITLQEELRRSEDMQIVGGPAALALLVEQGSIAAYLDQYVRIVGDHAILRELIQSSTRVIGEAFDATDDVDAILEAHEVRIHELRTRRMAADTQGLGVRSLGQVLDQVITGLRAGPTPGVIGAPWPSVNQLLAGGFHPGELVLIGGYAGFGKALALDTPLPTPTGWTTMGAVQAGDRLMGSDGRPVVVTLVSPVQRDRACYAVEFSDGATITADADHQWQTHTALARWSQARAASRPRTSAFSRDQRARTSAPAVVTTRAIAETLRYPGGSPRPNHSIPVCAPFDLPDVALPIPPYTLGAWLGDGHTASARLTCPDMKVPILDQIRAEGVSVQPIGADEFLLGSAGRSQAARDASLQAKLRAAGVLGNKHIPPVYLRASAAQRRALLAGLMDTDGTVANGGAVQLTTTSPALARGAAELIRTLGHRVTVTTKAVKGRSAATSTCYTLHWSTPDTVFRLPYKAERHRARRATDSRARSAHRYIVAVRPVVSVPVRCVQVDAADRLYLAGEACIPTHNTAMALEQVTDSAKRGNAGLVVSREMLVEALARRIISQHAGVQASALRAGNLDLAEWALIDGVLPNLKGLPVWMTDRVGSIAQIDALLRLGVERHAVKLLVVDYLQLIRGPRGISDKRLEVEAVSGHLKALAQEYRIVVMAISAMSRRERGAANRRPTVADLRESGRLEHDADIILLGWRPDNTKQETELIVAKGRGNKTGTVEMLFFGGTLTFEEKSDREPGDEEVPF